MKKWRDARESQQNKLNLILKDSEAKAVSKFLTTYLFS
jgi:hypothetical protein